MRALEDGFDRRDICMYNIKLDAKFDPLRLEPRCEKLLRRFGPE